KLFLALLSRRLPTSSPALPSGVQISSTVSPSVLIPSKGSSQSTSNAKVDLRAGRRVDLATDSGALALSTGRGDGLIIEGRTEASTRATPAATPEVVCPPDFRLFALVFVLILGFRLMRISSQS